jgi:hypothetical protein
MSATRSEKNTERVNLRRIRRQLTREGWLGTGTRPPGTGCPAPLSPPEVRPERHSLQPGPGRTTLASRAPCRVHPCRHRSRDHLGRLGSAATRRDLVQHRPGGAGVGRGRRRRRHPAQLPVVDVGRPPRVPGHRHHQRGRAAAADAHRPRRRGSYAAGCRRPCPPTGATTPTWRSRWRSSPAARCRSCSSASSRTRSDAVCRPRSSISPPASPTEAISPSSLPLPRPAAPRRP